MCLSHITYISNTNMDLDQNITSAQLLPLSPATYDGTEVTLARHHIIPAGVLHRFFNLILREHRDACRSADKTILKFGNFLNKLATDTVARLTTSTYDGLPDIRYCRRLLHETVELGERVGVRDLDEMHSCVLLTLFVWMPGNIVAGPARRRDHLGNTLDTNLIRIKNRTPLLASIYEHMIAYTGHDSSFGNRCELFSKIVDLLNLFASIHTEMTEYDERLWDFVDDRYMLRL